VLVFALTSAALSPVEAAEPAAEKVPNILRRVRTHEPRVREALATGAARSAAFREVLGHVESGDVIVYIELERQLRGKLAGRMRWVVSTKDARYVRVSLNPELSGGHFIATLAHELRHVAEVGDAPSVVDEATLTALYRGVGTERRSKSGAWDTEAAQVTGEVVRRELADWTAGAAQPATEVASAAGGAHRVFHY
jgi:hypothetical protein